LLFQIPISRNELTAATARYRFVIFEPNRIGQSGAITNGAAEAVATAQPRSDLIAEHQCFDRCHIAPESHLNMRARHVGDSACPCPPFDRKLIILGQEGGHEGYRLILRLDGETVRPFKSEIIWTKFATRRSRSRSIAANLFSPRALLGQPAPILSCYVLLA
jgi:hypothetical protein